MNSFTSTQILSTIPIFLRLISQLLTRNCNIAKSIASEHSGDFLHFLESVIVRIDSDEVRKTSIFIVFHIFQNNVGCRSLFSSLVPSLPSEILKILHTTQDREIQINGLSLLRLMTANSLTLKALVSVKDEGTTLPLVFKRYLLCKDRQLMISVAQCSASILSDPLEGHDYANYFLQQDLVPFVFEALGNVDALLLESLLCCCLLLAETDHFFSGCYTIYGIDSIIRATETCLGFHRTQTTVIAFKLLARIFQKQPKNLLLFTTMQQVACVFNLLKSGIANPLGTVSQHAIITSAAFIRRDHLLSPVPFSDVKGLLDISLMSISQCINAINSQMKDHVPSTSSSNTQHLEAVLILINAIQRLCKECNHDPTSIGTSYEAPNRDIVAPTSDPLLEELDVSLSQMFTETFIPCFANHAGILRNPALYLPFLDCLISLFDSVNPYLMDVTMTKLIETGFLLAVCEAHDKFNQDVSHDQKAACFERRNAFLCHCVRYQLGLPEFHCHGDSAPCDVMTSFENGLRQLFRLSDFTSVFHTDSAICGFSELNAQSCVLTLCHFSYFYNQSFIPANSLLPLLCHYLITKPAELTTIPLKFVTFLMATCSLVWANQEVLHSAPEYKNATRVLFMELAEVKSPLLIYTHHKDFLKWILTAENVITRNISLTMIRHCVQLSLRANDNQLMAEMLQNNQAFAQLYAEFLSEISDPNELTQFLSILVSLCSEAKLRGTPSFISQELPDVLANSLKTCMKGSEPDLYLETLAVTLKLLWIFLNVENETFATSTADISMISVLQQVMKVIQWAFENNQNWFAAETLHCMSQLIKTFAASRENGMRGICFVLMDSNILLAFEACLNGQNSPMLHADILTVLATLMDYQTKYEMMAAARITLNFNMLRHALFSDTQQIVLASLQICTLAIQQLNIDSPFVYLTGISERAILSESDGNGEKHFRLDDLRVLFFTALNLFSKEQENELVVSAVICTLQTIFLSCKKMDESLAKQLLCQYWTQKCLHNVLPNLISNEEVLNFVHVILSNLNVCNMDEISKRMWLNTLATINKIMEEARPYGSANGNCLHANILDKLKSAKAQMQSSNGETLSDLQMSFSQQGINT